MTFEEWWASVNEAGLDDNFKSVARISFEAGNVEGRISVLKQTNTRIETAAEREPVEPIEPWHWPYQD